MINCSSQLLFKIFLASILIINIFFISNFDKGIESTDESYLLLYALYPDNIIGRLTNFGIISEKILYLLNFNIFYFRIAGFLILASCSFILIKSFLFFYNNCSFKLFCEKYLIYSTGLVGVFCYYRYWVITPSYNLYNLSGVILFLSGLLFKINRVSLFYNFRSYFLISLGCTMCFINKPSTLIFLIFLLCIWLLIFYRKFFFQFLVIYFLIGSIIFYLYGQLFFNDFNFFLEDILIGYELIKTFDPRYNFVTLFIFSFKIIISNILSSYIFFLIQIMLFWFLRKNNFSQKYILAFPLVAVIIYNNLVISVISVLLHVVLTTSKDKLLKKANVVLLIIPYLIFSTSFGTNTNIVTHFQTSALLFFIFILHSLSLTEYRNPFKINFLIFFLIINISYNFYGNFFEPRRIQYNIFEQKNEYKVPGFNGKIYVDDFIFSYAKQISDLNEKIDRYNIEYLIDYTGRQPLLNILFNLKFISRPWWSGGYAGSNNYVKKILNISDQNKIARSLIVTYSDSDLQLLDLNNFKNIGIDFKNDYQILGEVILEKFVKNRKFNFIVWVPKKYAK